MFESTKTMYKTRMDEYLNASQIPPSSYELRQQHQLIAFECLDDFRKKWTLNNGAEWQVEAAIKSMFEEYLKETRAKRASTNNAPILEHLETKRTQAV